MAYDSSNEERILVGDVKKNDRGEVIRVSVIKSGNTEKVDARLFYTNDEKELCPTAKGFRINAELAGELQELFRKVAEEDYD